MKVANIVSSNKVSVSEEFNVVDSMDDIIQGLPTLIIGIDNVIKLYPDFNILDITLAPNVYWTFKRTEKRDKHEEDLRWFIRKVYEDLMKDVVYVFVDPIQYQLKTIKKIIRKLYTLEEPITFVNGQMIYVYGDKIIFGFDLKLFKYIGLNIDKIKLKIKERSAVFLDDEKILIEYKKNVESLGNKVRFIPYLYTIRNGKNNTSSFIHIP